MDNLISKQTNEILKKDTFPKEVSMDGESLNCPTLLAIREMHAQTTLWFHLTSVKWLSSWE